MRLIHFSASPKVIEPRTVKQIGPTPNGHNYMGAKPQGLWVSDEDDEYGWKWWCQNEEFKLDKLVYEHLVTLRPGAKILYIRSAKALDRFTTQYKDERAGTATKVLAKGRSYKDRQTVMDIDWALVAGLYQGIIITPYIWSRRLEPYTSWYYGWDCASGCIWDADAILAITPLNTKNPIPKDWKPFDSVESRVKLKKLMEAFNALP